MAGKVAIITGGDSGIGRAVAIAFAKEGADVAIAYLYEREDAATTQYMVAQYGRRCLLVEGDLRRPEFCREVVRRTIECYGRLDILINNQGVQFPQNSIADISDAQLEDTFRTNIFPMFYMTKAALPHLCAGSAIVNTASVTAYAGRRCWWTIRQPKGRSSRLRALFPFNWSERAFALTPSRPDQFGRRLSSPAIRPNM